MPLALTEELRRSLYDTTTNETEASERSYLSSHAIPGMATSGDGPRAFPDWRSDDRSWRGIIMQGDWSDSASSQPTQAWVQSIELEGEMPTVTLHVGSPVSGRLDSTALTSNTSTFASITDWANSHLKEKATMATSVNTSTSISLRVRGALSELRRLREQREALEGWWKANSSVRCTDRWSRGASTPEEWARIQERVYLNGLYHTYRRKLEAIQSSDEWGKWCHDNLNTARYANVAVEIPASHAKLLNQRFYVYLDPLRRLDERGATRYLVSLGGSHGSPTFEDLKAGAVFFAETGSWYENTATMQEALGVRLFTVLSNGELRRNHPISKAQAALYSRKKTAPDGTEVLIRDSRVIKHYHEDLQSRERNLALDPDVARTTGIELEFDAGRTSMTARQDIAEDWIIATNGNVHIERDGSVSGFELVTGHGKPSTLRQLLTPIFRDPRIRDFRVGQRTGAHVHVTYPESERERLSSTALIRTHGLLRRLYRDMADRVSSRYAFSVEAATYDRYAEISVCGDLPTMEFRLFKMDKSLGRIIRNAQFAWAYTDFLVNVMAPKSEEELQETQIQEFWDFVAAQPREETLELRAWAKAHSYNAPLARGELLRTYRELGLPATVS